MLESFARDIETNKRNYSKIMFNIGKIRNIDKIYSAYNIPKDETLIAYIKSSVILFTLSVDGNIITDKAIYSHPSHDDWASNNRLPFSELCKYIILQSDENAEVVMVSSYETRTIRGNTIFGKNVAGAEIVLFLSDLQKCFLSKYEWAREQQDSEFRKIISTARQKMRCGNIPQILDEALCVIKRKATFYNTVISLQAEYIFRNCNPKDFNDFINSVENPEAKKLIYKSADTYIKSFIEDLSDIKLNIDLTYLQTVQNNLVGKYLSPEQRLILGYVNIRLRNQEAYENVKPEIIKSHGEGMLRKLEIFKGRYYNAQMLSVYEKIKRDIMPSDECFTWTDSIGLTPLHYAIILGKNKIIEELLYNGNWLVKSPLNKCDEADALYDYEVLAAYVQCELRKSICLFTNEMLLSKLDLLNELKQRIEAKNEQISNIKRRKNNLYAQYREAGQNGLYSRQQEINDYITMQEYNMYGVIEERDELLRRAGDTERIITNLQEKLLQEADSKIEQIKKSKNTFVVFMLNIFKNSNFLYRLISNNADRCLLYYYNGFSFITPVDIKLNLMYFDDPLGERKYHYDNNDDYGTQYYKKSYGNSWFSLEAHNDESKLKEEYRKLAKQYHPDISTNPRATIIFQEITQEKNDILKSIS